MTDSTANAPKRRRRTAAAPEHDDDQAAALVALRAARERARATAAKRDADFRRGVALAVSSEPQRIDWYEHPGPVERRTVMEACGLTTMTLHRLMERYRTENPPRRGRLARR